MMASQIYSQPASTSTGSDARTNVLFAVCRLKEKSPQSIPADELISFVLSASARQDAQRVNLFTYFLKANEKVNYDSKTDSYSFRPVHSIFDADGLLHYLQKQDTALGISVRDLKDGWPNATDAIDELESQHKLLVTRNKKDNVPRMVWLDDPTLHVRLDQEYKDLWEKIVVPEKHDDVIKELVKDGLKPAGTVSVVKAVKKAEKKKKKPRRGAKITNTHMGDVFKNYDGI